MVVSAPVLASAGVFSLITNNFKLNSPQVATWGLEVRMQKRILGVGASRLRSRPIVSTRIGSQYLAQYWLPRTALMSA